MRLWDHTSKAHLLPLVLMITWVLCFMVSLLLNLLKAICKVKKKRKTFFPLKGDFGLEVHSSSSKHLQTLTHLA